jgi:hypothetical protein
MPSARSRGGPEGLRREYFTSFGEVDLGDEGRIPPHLNAVGSKLQAGWIKTVIERGEKIRPYMATRMPKFGLTNAGKLPDLFDHATRLRMPRRSPMSLPQAWRRVRTNTGESWSALAD